MSLVIDIQIRDDVSQRLHNLQTPQAKRRVDQRMGLALKRLVQENLIRKGPNKNFPGATTGFWGRAAAATSLTVDNDGPTVTIAQQGVAQRYHGGTITARESKYLTIPVSAEAYGRRAREFDDLDVMIRRPGGGPPRAVALGRKEILTVPGENGLRKEEKWDVLYILKPSVVQEADPTVLPPKDATQKAVNEAAEKQIQREWNKEAGNYPQ